MKKKDSKSQNFFETFAAKATIATGSTTAILISFGATLPWAATGPLFHYSETWQLVIKTGTTITFLMIFLNQKSQNKKSMAVQLKLNELVVASELAGNRLVDLKTLLKRNSLFLKSIIASSRKNQKRKAPRLFVATSNYNKPYLPIFKNSK